MEKKEAMLVDVSKEREEMEGAHRATGISSRSRTGGLADLSVVPDSEVRELLKLGTSLQAAISVAISRKGPWHLSRTLATQTGMTNKWLKDQGLLSVKELWVNLHYPATAR
jgi:hypothetical protein